MNLLTKEQVQKIIKQSLEDCRNVKGYRLGQALFNNLPMPIGRAINGTDKDMFYVRDEDLAYTMLLNLAIKL